MKQISTNKLAGRKNVEIDGHPYVVRKVGAGDEMTLAQLLRELDKLAKKEKAEGLDEADENRILEIERETLDVYVNCFDDGEGGEKSRALVLGLTSEELPELMKQIFGEGKQDAAPETQVS